ncbi:ubiquitin carboxy-terminal hydrolase L1, isoform CRA_b [Zychaea mexicana]|uniref:ubiquitin carboxyl-terminal hydrolase n=1 Tax=Zychaea mexicana TaxID=64656 RepID=UPI0022FE8EBD|nr:ubiquitin carboxyl-terminal hydrolase [Zychaea mexicana]KAI9494677.1 ubiquitin carboxy-terminal hydrolase L1, isoform CRA_b [Zychaea mexicana]
MENLTDCTLGPKPKQMWIRLEGNPEVWNKMIHENGVDKAWCFHDIYGFDEESLGMIPRPVTAIIFLYPVTDSAKKFRQQEKVKLTQQGQDISPKVLYFKQTIGHACGMMALIHALANNKQVLGPGLFQDIVTQAEPMTIEERAGLLENCAQLATVHKNAAMSGQTEPRLDDSDRHYFVAFTEVDGNLYELDGSKAFPINHGPSSDIVKSTAQILRQYIERDSAVHDFSAMALSKSD